MATTLDPVSTLSAANAAGSGGKTANDAASADRFLKLLVTQLQNQDPLNPLDNAQITSQMAQINTVGGIEKLNTTVAGLNGQFVQMQMLQGTALVGRDVTLQGNRIDLVQGSGTAGFELAGTAERVKVEVLSAAGRVVDTLDLGTQPAGRGAFQWTPADSSLQADRGRHSFRIKASNGTAPVEATPLMLDRVKAVSTAGDRLMLEMAHSGRVPYADVKAFN